MKKSSVVDYRVRELQQATDARYRFLAISHEIQCLGDSQFNVHGVWTGKCECLEFKQGPHCKARIEVVDRGCDRWMAAYDLTSHNSGASGPLCPCSTIDIHEHLQALWRIWDNPGQDRRLLARTFFMLMDTSSVYFDTRAEALGTYLGYAITYFERKEDEPDAVKMAAQLRDALSEVKGEPQRGEQRLLW